MECDQNGAWPPPATLSRSGLGWAVPYRSLESRNCLAGQPGHPLRESTAASEKREVVPLRGGQTLSQTPNAKRSTPGYKLSSMTPSCVTWGDFDREIMSSCVFSKEVITGARLGFWPRIRLQIVET